MVYCPLCFIHYLCYVPKHVGVEGKVISRDVKMALQQNITNQSARISWNKYITLTMLFLNGFDITAIITPYHSGGKMSFSIFVQTFLKHQLLIWAFPDLCPCMTTLTKCGKVAIRRAFAYSHENWSTKMLKLTLKNDLLWGQLFKSFQKLLLPRSAG